LKEKTNVPPTDRSLSDVVKDIIRNLQDIVRSEIRLARTEVGEELTKAKTASVLMALGAVAGLFSVFFVLLTAVYILSRLVADWAAALIVAAGLSGVAAIMLSMGSKRFGAVHGAPKTVKSLEENFPWAKQQSK
jgi:cytochrome c biogenesis protein CcdA